MNSVVPRRSTWLDSLAKEREYWPKVVGDNYQPLGVAWSRKRGDPMLIHRAMHQFVSFHDKHGIQILLLGGWCSKRKTRLNDVLLNSGFGTMFKRIRSTCEWSPRCSFAAVAGHTGDCVYVIGGDDGQVQSDVWLSRDKCRTFSLKTAKAGWSDRTEFALALIDAQTLVVCGGRSSSSMGHVFNDVWLSIDSGCSWREVCSRAPWTRRASASLLAVNGLLLMAGGIGAVAAFDDVWSSSDLGATWSLVSIKNCPWKARRSFAFVQDHISDEILIFGGANSDGGPLCDSWASIDLGVTWIPRSPLPTESTIAPSCIVDADGRLVLVESSNQQFAYESVSDLRYVRKDCAFLLLVGLRLEKIVPRELWVGRILPFAIDTRQLWKRNRSEWEKLP